MISHILGDTIHLLCVQHRANHENVQIRSYLLETTTLQHFFDSLGVTECHPAEHALEYSRIVCNAFACQSKISQCCPVVN